MISEVFVSSYVHVATRTHIVATWMRTFETQHDSCKDNLSRKWSMNIIRWHLSYVAVMCVAIAALIGLASDAAMWTQCIIKT